MVDAQAEFALEHGAAVVEPCVERAFGVNFAQAVGQAEVEQGFKPLSFDGGTMDFFVPFFGVVAVGIGRGDVEVAEQDEFGVCGHFGADELGQCGKPLFFVLEFWAVQGFAVDAIDVDDAHAVDGGGDDAALRVVGEGGQAAMYVLRFVPADDGDAVIGFLAAPDAVPAHHLQGGGREFVLVEFEFL